MVVLKPKLGATTASGVGSTLYKSYGADKPLVDSLFGKVQAGSVLSYQQPIPPSDSVVMYEDAPPLPSVPLERYHLNPTECSFVPTHQEQLTFCNLATVTPSLKRQQDAKVLHQIGIRSGEKE
uniref:Uncharacterized protein n=1 Tax=Nothobranchius kuhntae TaxID=321403 RepID=A0A1A8IBM1_NOTKU